MVLPKVLRKCCSSQQLKDDYETAKSVQPKQDMSQCHADQSCSISCQCMCELCAFGRCQESLACTFSIPRFSMNSKPSTSWDPSVGSDSVFSGACLMTVCKDLLLYIMSVSNALLHFG